MIYSLPRCLGFCFHVTRIVYEEGSPRQRFSCFFCLSDRGSKRCATRRKEREFGRRLEAQLKLPQGQMASRPFNLDEEKRNPLGDGSEKVKGLRG